MPKLKRLPVSPCFEATQRHGHCVRNQKHEICQGEKCLFIKKKMWEKYYCMECAALMLHKARRDLDCLCNEIKA